MNSWTEAQIAEINQEMGSACMDMLVDELVSAGVVASDIPPMFYPEAIIAIARERDALRARIDTSVTGTVERVGDDEDGQPRVLIFSTRDALLHGPNIACKRVAILVME
jgi:hypothetical protein